MKKSVPAFGGWLIAIIIILFNSNLSNAQDTTRLSLPEAEKIFLQKNLSLLAAQYNIDASKALIQQARLWDNPYLVTDQNVYDGKFFRHDSNNGQVYIQVQQLIRTAGKIRKQTQLATDNAVLAQEQFDDLLRSLQYALRGDFIETEHLLEQKKVYDIEITHVDRLVKGMEEIYKVGNISLKDYMRLKATLFSLQNELVNVQSQLIPVQAEIKLLLQATDSSFVLPVMNYSFPVLANSQLPVPDTLVALAMNQRPDARIEKTTLLYEQHNLVYQKALAKPDITVGPEYDRLSTYTPNYVGLSVSLPLNIFNRNQGNIKAAKFNVQQQQTQVDYQAGKIKNEVMTALQKVNYFRQINNQEQREFSGNYDKLFQGMLDSYGNRQISLLELTDFIDSYKDIKLKLVEQHNNLLAAIAELNYTVNYTVIPLQ
ncbi:MAG: TolC family protein [Bacteroidota bacterium]|nr:TolC family protein [Bacteroidota bacterium]